LKSTKQKNNKRIVTASALALAVMLAATACGAKNSDVNQPEASPPSQVDQLPEGSGIVEPGVAGSGDSTNNPESTNPIDSSNTGSNNGTDKEAGEQALQGEGVFVGIADSHSIEVETADGYLVFQYTDELSDAINKLNPDSKVKYSYTVKKLDDGSGLEQNWLVSIKHK